MTSRWGCMNRKSSLPAKVTWRKNIPYLKIVYYRGQSKKKKKFKKIPWNKKGLLRDSIGKNGDGKETLYCAVCFCCFSLCDPLGCSPPGPSVQGMLEAAAMPSSWGIFPTQELNPGVFKSPALAGGLSTWDSILISCHLKPKHFVNIFYLKITI